MRGVYEPVYHLMMFQVGLLRKAPETVLAMARKPTKLPDYFTSEEASALVTAAPSYQVRMAMLIMIRARLRESECLFLRPTDIQLD